jgi:hypothetical protein
MVDGDIVTAVQGVALCNKWIRKLEQDIEVCRSKEDYATASRMQYTLVKWAEQLQHFQRMASQLGETKTDVTQVIKGKGSKVRYNAD